MPLCRCLLFAAWTLCCLAVVSPANDQAEPTDAERIAQLIKQLGADKFQEREEAAKALDAIGISALDALRAAEKSPDAEVRRRAGDLVTAIESRSKQFMFFAQTVHQAVELIQGQFVLELDPGELTEGAIRALYQQVDQKVPPDVERRLAKVKELSAKERSGLLFDARFRLGTRLDLDKDRDCHHAIRGMVKQFDPNGDYFDGRLYTRELVALPVGIGVHLRDDPATGRLKVFTPVKDGPAYKAGIRGGDTILKITLNDDAAGQPLAQPLVINARNLSAEEAQKKLHGQPGSKVELTVQRAGEPKPLTFELVRNRVAVESVHGCKRQDDDSWDYWLDAEKRLGYLRISMLARETLQDVRAALDQLERDGLRGLVLDLRFNPGGLLNQAVDVSDLFIDDGLIVDIRQRKQNNPYRSDDNGGFLKFPLACLINGDSRSGTEIMAACLQDHNRAVLVGERSGGKGSVQNIVDFRPTGHQIKLTTAVFHRPDGRKLDRMRMPGRDADEWGVTPNSGYRLPLPDKEQQSLKEHLERQGVIWPRGAQPKEGGYIDRQLHMALDYLKSMTGDR